MIGKNSYKIDLKIFIIYYNKIYIMSEYNCDKCGKKFNQKSHYDSHKNNKNTCVNENKLKEIIQTEIKNILNVDGNTLINNDKTAKVVRDEGLDKFYTIPSIVDKCINKISEVYGWNNWELVVEPSAGNGSFLLKIPSSNKIGLDISPEHNDIIKKDFFEYSPDKNKNNILVIGNPPFGKISSLAIKFFNHAAQWANVIAFIIPRTFRRISVQNKLHDHFHLLFDEDIPIKPCSFNPPMMVKCCFQIWEKKSYKRDKVTLEMKHNDWEFLQFGPKDEYGQPTPPTNADFAIRAYGGKCGDIVIENLQLLRPKSWHWIKCNIDKNILIDRFKKLDFSISLNTARQNSIGRGELVALYSDFINVVNPEF